MTLCLLKGDDVMAEKAINAAFKERRGGKALGVVRFTHRPYSVEFAVSGVGKGAGWSDWGYGIRLTTGDVKRLGAFTARARDGDTITLQFNGPQILSVT